MARAEMSSIVRWPRDVIIVRWPHTMISMSSALGSSVVSGVTGDPKKAEEGVMPTEVRARVLFFAALQHGACSCKLLGSRLAGRPKFRGLVLCSIDVSDARIGSFS